MKPTVQEVRNHLREHYDLTAAELQELLRTPLHPGGLRDEFAGKAMQAIISLGVYSTSDCAEEAYLYAGAMLDVRGTL